MLIRGGWQNFDISMLQNRLLSAMLSSTGDTMSQSSGDYDMHAVKNMLEGKDSDVEEEICYHDLFHC